ncbi:hypothetical protein [Mycobacterium canetti]|nr:hypothetical protein [Mycobacterium canetti]
MTINNQVSDADTHGATTGATAPKRQQPSATEKSKEQTDALRIDASG